MTVKIIGAPLLVAAVAVTALIAGRPAAAEAPVRLAMHDMMGMPPQAQSGMQMNDQMQQPRQPGQMGGPAQGQMGPSGPMGMPMNDPMPMQQQGQMGGGMQIPMPEGGSRGQPGMSGQTGAMNDNMMRMMNDHMRIMNERMRMGMPGMATGPAMVDLTDRLDGRLAFIRAELHITEAQDSAWKSFAEGLRSGRDHLLEARHQLQQPYASSVDRLARYERHLTERLEALRSARTSFTQLYAALNDAQKRTADELIAPLIATF